jgi:phosphoribosylanthranilate isomerase
VVNPDDDALDAIVEAMPLDMIQLHGQESPDRVAAVRARYGLPVMKAMGVAEEDDLSGLMEMSLAADQLLIDAKPAKGELPGGNGLTFDWRLLVGRKWLKPWMLAGGLHAGNVAEAVRLTGARQVDLSSGVESAPGVKDHGKIREFMAAVRGG